MRTTSWRAGIGAALMAGALAAAGGCATAGSEQAARAPTVTTSQGAEGNSAGGMEDVSERALEVLKDQGITVTSTLTAPADAARVVEGQRAT
jgi:ABC-type glycerol-3-phosphate transport system substrate-binding protein